MDFRGGDELGHDGAGVCGAVMGFDTRARAGTRKGKAGGGLVAMRNSLAAAQNFVCRELEICSFKIFEIAPSAANDESPLAPARSPSGGT